MAKAPEIDKIINQAVSAEWFFLTKRPDIPPLPVWHKLKISAVSQENKKIYGTGIPVACFWYGNNVEFYLHGKEYRLAIKQATKILYSPPGLKKCLLKLKQACVSAKRAALALNKRHGKNLTNKQLFNLYAAAVDKYVLSYVYGFITWCTPVLQHDAKLVISKYRRALNKINVSPDQALGILLVPDNPTFYQEKEKELNELSKKYQRLLRGYKSESFVLSHHPELYKAIEKFIKHYGWVGFNYVGPALDYRAVVAALLPSREKVQSGAPTKNDICRACKFKSREKHIFHALEMIAYTKDFRNVTDDYVHYCFSNFYSAVARRTGLAKKAVQFLWDDELSELMAGQGKVTAKYLAKKRKFCAALAGYKALGAKQYYLGNEARAYWERVVRTSNQSLKISSPSIIKGTIASAGRATGVVKIIHSAREVNKVKKGDILVAGMTSPKYMPAILNAGAIITDDGGLTCHAAIIARELKKPCIIGTKIATQVFKDGDTVEVDANKGIVRKL